MILEKHSALGSLVCLDVEQPHTCWTVWGLGSAVRGSGHAQSCFQDILACYCSCTLGCVRQLYLVVGKVSHLVNPRTQSLPVCKGVIQITNRSSVARVHDSFPLSRILHLGVRNRKSQIPATFWTNFARRGLLFAHASSLGSIAGVRRWMPRSLKKQRNFHGFLVDMRCGTVVGGGGDGPKETNKRAWNARPPGRPLMLDLDATVKRLFHKLSFVARLLPDC
jgi:hypothetical protein